MSSRPTCTPLHAATWLIAIGSMAALLFTSSSSAAGLWSQLSDSDREAVLTEVKTELAVTLRSDKNSPLPRGPNGEIDRGFHDLVANLAGADSTSLSTYAGEIAAGEYDRAIHSAIGSGASDLASSFRRAALDKLPEGSATRVYLDYFADKGDAWKEIARMAIDDRYGWGEVADATWTKLNKEAADDISKMTESALTNLLTDAVGSWATMGYVAFLKAQVAYTGELEKLAVTISAGNYYDQYRSIRDSGKNAAAAWDRLLPYLIGESGMPSVLGSLRSGSARGFRAGGFLERHVTLERLRDKFEQCYPGADRCFVRAEDLYSVDRAARDSELKRRQKQTQAELRAELAASGGITRAELRSVYAHVGDILRRSLRERYQLGDDQQAGLARTRDDIEVLLARLRQLQGALRGPFAESPELATSLESSRAEADALFARAEEIGRFGFECRQAEGATADDGTAALAADVEGAIRRADDASNRACDYDDPQSRADAAALRDRVLTEWNRTKAAALAGRASLARLAGQLAEQPVAATNGQARQQLENLVDALETSRVFINARAVATRLATIGGRSAGQAEIAREWMREIEKLAGAWRGVPDIDQILDEARRLVGEGSYAERADSIGTMVASISVATQRGDQQARWFELSLPSFENARSKAVAALSECAEVSASPGGLHDLLLTADSRLDTNTTAADLCLARSQQLLEGFDDHDNDDDTGWQAATLEPEPSGGDDAWQPARAVPKCVTPAPAQAKIDGAIASMQSAITQPDAYAKVLTAVDELTAAASDPSVCNGDRGRIRDALQLVRDAQSLQLAQAQGQTSRVHARSRERRAQSATAWRNAASALTGLLTASNRGGNTSTPPTTSGDDGRGNTASGADAGQADGECDALQVRLQQRIVEWQSLLRQRSSFDAATWCRKVFAWQRDFTTKVQQAERMGCASVSGTNARALLEQSRSSLAAASCDSD